MTPLVSIGLPVYNGENYLAKAIDSVLKQTYSNLELIISDNGSTDESETICRNYSSQDARVRYYRSEENRGASWNYNRTVELARGEYFRWLAHDDLLARELVAKSIVELERRPDVVCCITWFRDIDEDGNSIDVKRSTVDFDAQQPDLRFKSMSELRPTYKCEEVFGMIRLDILHQTKLIANYPDSDRTLIAELGLHGPFYEIPEPLFLHRLHTNSSVERNPSRQDRATWFDPTKEGKYTFPYWRQFGELVAVIERSPLSRLEKMRCYSHLILWVKASRRVLRSDFSWALHKALDTS